MFSLMLGITPYVVSKPDHIALLFMARLWLCVVKIGILLGFEVARLLGRVKGKH